MKLKPCQIIQLNGELHIVTELTLEYSKDYIKTIPLREFLMTSEIININGMQMTIKEYLDIREAEFLNQK